MKFNRNVARLDPHELCFSLSDFCPFYGNVLVIFQYFIKVNEIRMKKGVELLQHLVDFYQAQAQYVPITLNHQSVMSTIPNDQSVMSTSDLSCQHPNCHVSDRSVM